MARFLASRRILSPWAPCRSTVLMYCSSFSNQGKCNLSKDELCTPAACENATPTPADKISRVMLPTLIPTRNDDQSERFSVELVHFNVWPQTLVWMDEATAGSESLKASEKVNEMCRNVDEGEEFPDFDQIEDLRLKKKLFYKLDRDSMEFEEYNLNFHRKKSLKKSQEKLTKAEMEKQRKKEEKQMKAETMKQRKKEEKQMKAELKKQHKKEEKPTKTEAKKERKGLEKRTNVVKQNGGTSLSLESGMLSNGELDAEGKRVRTQTFNQQTAPYHLPFCLDIFITKGSVRASIIHRATSKVVAVAHSISKDLKFDVGSRKDSKACAAVGGVLAQRALEDDIHNVVYTPRKGDKIEGKLQIVLQSIIDNGIDVKVKLKQKRSMKRRALVDADQ